MMRFTWRSGILAGGLGALLAAPAAAQAPAPDRWNFSLMPYVWAAGISGNATPFAGAPTIRFSRSFSDQIRDMDGALFLAGEAQVNRFSLLTDVMHVRASRRGTVGPGIPARGRVSQTTFTLTPALRVLSSPRGGIDVLAGIRFWWLSADVSVAGGLRSASPRRDFADPVIGVRGTYAFTPRWSVVGQADVGGFGLGSQSTVVLNGLVNYRVADSVVVAAGYRAMMIRYREGGMRVNATTSGPILGVTLRF